MICKDEEEETVAEVKIEPAKVNSNITVIKYTGNGAFTSQNGSVVTRVASTKDQQAYPQCGGIFRNLQNLVESPKFVSPRPICNLRCEYQIVSPYICENEFHVQFLDFAIDSSRDCENDRVIINHSEIMCGKIIGVKKFRTEGGVLNITFSSKSWDLKEGRGFRLLVTRLPCIDDTNEQQTEVDSLEPNAPKADENEHRCFNVNSSYSVDADPIVGQGQGRPVYGVPNTIYGVYNRTRVVGRQDIPVLPLPTPPPFGPSTYPPYVPPVQPTFPPFIPPGQPPILPPQFLPQCCRNNYNQQRFLLISQGFPAYMLQNNDCIFVIQRSSPNVCRLRIVFKYFLLDDPYQVPQGQFGCINNFVEVDGQRICGCKTNMVYESQWGFEPKVIRMRTLPGQFANAQGFILEIIQEACPFKIQDNSRREVRHIKPEKFILHPFFNKRHDQQPAPFIPNFHHVRPDIDDAFKSKFFQPQPNNFGGSVCVFNHSRLLQLKFESLGTVKQYCFPTYA